MSRVADGATTRRERILEMLTWINSFMPTGSTTSQIQLHMSIAHGLTFRKTLEYLTEMQMGGLLFIEGGRYKIRQDNLRRLLELMGREHLIQLEDLDGQENVDQVNPV